VGRRSEEGLIEHTQHSPPCRISLDESYHSPAMVLWRGPSDLPCYQTAYTGVILMQITYTDTVRRARMVGCQSRSQGTRYRVRLIVYDIVVVKIFDRYCNIALSIRALQVLMNFLGGRAWPKE